MSPVLRPAAGYHGGVEEYLLVAAVTTTVAAAIGFAVGSWWALPLAVLVPPLAFVPAGSDSDGAPQWLWALILVVPPAVIGAAIGVVARRRRRDRSGGGTART